MKILLWFKCILLILCLSPLSSPYANTISTLATIEGLRTSINDVINNAANKGDYLLFRLGTEVLLSLESWENANKEILNTGFDRLDQNQQIFFSNTRAITKKLDNGIGKSFQHMEKLTNDVHNVIDSMPIVDAYPIVSSFTPTVLTPKDIRDGLRLTINGSAFRYGPPHIIFNGKKYRPIGNTSNKLVFLIDDLQEINPAPMQVIAFDLRLQSPKDGILESVIQDTEEKSFQLPVLASPKRLGTYTLTTWYTKSNYKSEKLSREFHHSGKSGCVNINQGVMNNKRSIRNITPVREWGASSSQKLTTKNSKGFTVNICVSAQNKPLVGYPPGYRHVIYSWEETWIEQLDATDEKEGNLYWDSDASFNLNDNIERFELKVKSFDGRTYIFNGTDLKGLFDVQYKTDSKQLLISPESII